MSSPARSMAGASSVAHVERRVLCAEVSALEHAWAKSAPGLEVAAPPPDSKPQPSASPLLSFSLGLLSRGDGGAPPPAPISAEQQERLALCGTIAETLQATLGRKWAWQPEGSDASDEKRRSDVPLSWLRQLAEGVQLQQEAVQRGSGTVAGLQAQCALLRLKAESAQAALAECEGLLAEAEAREEDLLLELDERCGGRASGGDEGDAFSPFDPDGAYLPFGAPSASPRPADIPAPPEQPASPRRVSFWERIAGTGGEEDSPASGTQSHALEANGVEAPSLSPPAAPPTAERSPRTLEPHERWNPAETPGNPLRAPLAPLRDEAGDGATALFDADGLPHDTDTVSDGDSDADETLSLSEPVPG